MNQLVLPSQACRRLQHPIETRAKQPGPGRYEYCALCTLGYEMAITTLGDTEQADEFVRTLRH